MLGLEGELRGPPALPPPPLPPDDGLPCPPITGRYLPLIYPPANGKVVVGLVSSAWYGWCSHWHEGRTRPHVMEPEGSCPQCNLGMHPRWNGYALCVAAGTRRHGIVQVSGEAWLSCPALRALNGQLRGCVLTITRSGAGKNGITMAVLAPVEGEPDVPPERDVRPFLSRFWSMQEDWLEWQGGTHRTGIAPPGGWKGGAP